MRSDDLTEEQARALKNKLQPMLGYLARLKRRMRYRGFPPDDPLMAAVLRAEEAMHALHIQAHYLTCGDVTMRLPSQHRDQAEGQRVNKRINCE